MRCSTTPVIPSILILLALYLPLGIGVVVQPNIQALRTTVDVCNLVDSVTKVYIIEPVYINTYVQQNTTFSVNDHLTITVDNAPPSFDGVVQGTSTTIITSSHTLYGISQDLEQT
jgi:hypothetical protein